jgi:hypothetical protein
MNGLAAHPHQPGDGAAGQLIGNGGQPGDGLPNVGAGDPGPNMAIPGAFRLLL